jgi:hypothetical protein
LLETLAVYDALQLDIDAESAAREMRALIQPGVFDSDELRATAELLQVRPEAFLAGQARSCIDRIFEDVFQGIYWDAYAELSSAEKFDLLTLALSDGDRDGMFLEWMLRELINQGDPRAVTTCRRFALEVQAGSSFPQAATAAYVLGIEGCARWDEVPVERPPTSEPVQVAWYTLGDILFWLHKDKSAHRDTIASLWQRFDGPALIAAGDVLFQVSKSSWFLSSAIDDLDLAVLFPSDVKRIVEGCLGHEGILPSVFSFPTVFDERLVTFLIKTLGRCGDSGSLSILKVYAEIERFGSGAIDAIESIQQRLLRANSSAAVQEIRPAR